MDSVEREHTNQNEDKKIKKVFNKKKWREQRFSQKAKVERWENVRRKQVQRHFKKSVKKLNLDYEFNGNDKSDKTNIKQTSRLKEAQLKYQKIQQIKEDRRKERERIRQEKIKAIEAYKEKRKIRFQKLSQKTSKGQPLMRSRIELLLEKIQKDYAD